MDFWCHYHHVLGFHIHPGFLFYSFKLFVCYYTVNYLYGFVLCLWRRQRQPTPVLLPGQSHGWRSLLGCSPWGRWGSDTTEQLHFHALEKEMATHSSVLAWRIPGTGEPGGLPSMGSHRVRHNKRLSSSSSMLENHFLEDILDRVTLLNLSSWIC